MTSIAIRYPLGGTLEYAQNMGVFETFGENERERIDSISSPHAKELSLGGLIALKHLTDRAGADGRLEIQRGDNGKPYFKDSPYFFNLSHSGDLSVAVLSDKRAGIDIERVMPRHSLRKIAKRFFSETEYVRYEQSGDSAEEFYRIWTAKEALVKYKGASLATSLSGEYADGTEEYFKTFSLMYNADMYIITVCLPCEDNVEILEINNTI